jgi:hypothetical protein
LLVGGGDENSTGAPRSICCCNVPELAKLKRTVVQAATFCNGCRFRSADYDEGLAAAETKMVCRCRAAFCRVVNGKQRHCNKVCNVF